MSSIAVRAFRNEFSGARVIHPLAISPKLIPLALIVDELRTGALDNVTRVRSTFFFKVVDASSFEHANRDTITEQCLVIVGRPY